MDLRRFHPRTKGIGVSLRHGLEERLDGLATDDLAIACEHPIRDVRFLEPDHVALSLARQIAWRIGESSRIAAVPVLPHVAHPDVLPPIPASRKTHLEGVTGLRRFWVLVGSPERRERGARFCDRSR